MSRVIYFGVDLHGHVNPSLGLVQKLVEQGEEVFYYCSDAFRDKIERTGAIFRSYRGLLGFGTHQGSGVDTFLIFADFIVSKSQIIVDALHEEVKQLQPDYILHDAFCLWGKQWAEKLDIPGVALIANFPFIDEMAKMDPDFFMEYVLQAADDPLYKKHKGNHDMYRKLLEKLSRIIATKYGLGSLNIINDVFGSKQPLNIILTSRDFQLYAEAFDESYWFAGYTLSPRVEPVDFPYEWLDERPLVYIAFGTILNDLGELIRCCIQAFANADVQVVVSIGNKINGDAWGNLPSHILVVPYVPQLELLSRADAFVTHGGANSIYESLCNHVPMVVIPQVFDEYMGALMVERAGAGIYLRNREIRPSDIQQAVNEVRIRPEYKRSCERIHQSFKATGGLDAAVNKILHYAHQRIAYET